MKPGARAEEDWENEPVRPVLGSAETQPASSFDGVAAVLWVPDPEQRHGWREGYVRRAPERSRRKIGFGR